MFPILVEHMPAYDSIWILGDGFVCNTYEQHFDNAIIAGNKLEYIKAHYNMAGCFHTNPALEPSLLARLHNTLVHTINEYNLLLKVILVILDDDLLDDINHYDFGLSLALGKMIEWLTNQFHNTITAYKEQLPSRSCKFKYPAIIWALIPNQQVYDHYNDFKNKYNIQLQKAVCNFREMDTIQLTEWNTAELEYFEGGSMSTHGKATYWHAINKAFETWDRNNMRSNLA